MTLYTHLADESIALEVVQNAIGKTHVAIDTETNGQDIRDGRGYAQGVSIAYDDTAIYLPFRHSNLPRQNYELRRFLPALQQIIDDSTIIYHNAKFDLASLQTLGLSVLGRRFVDTMVLAHLVDESRPYSGKGLDSCVKFYDAGTGKKASELYTTAVKTIGYENVTASLTCEYAMNDAWITLNLYRKLVPLLRKEDLGAVWEHKMKFIELLLSMESKGVAIDQELCEVMARQGRHMMALLRSELGMLNPMSPPDLKKLLLDQLDLPVVKLTPGGKPCFDKTAMEVYEQILERSSNPTAQKILAYRGWQKSTTSNFEPYIHLLSPDERLRCNYNLHRARTGRMSCSTPNLQQIPRSGAKPWNGSMKKCFIPRPGYVLVEGDYSQLEFRLSSAFAKEQTLLDAFNGTDRDVFQEMADLLGIERYEAKTRTYAILYGAGARRLAQVCGVDLGGGKRIREDFFNLYPSMQRASSFASSYVKSHKRIPTWSGRYLHLDHVDDAHKAFNNVTQGGAADIVERTMLRAKDWGLDNEDCRLLLQVHDSLVWEVREDLQNTLFPELVNCMEAVTPDFGVHFKASLHYWGGNDIDISALRETTPTILV